MSWRPMYGDYRMRNDRQSGAWSWRNTAQGYGWLSIALHWLMLLLLIAAVFACIELYEIFPEDSPTGETLEVWHIMLGLSVFALVWLRLLVYLTGPAPHIEPPPAVWQRWAAKLMHFALYALMIGLPLTGWLLLSAEGEPIPFFGMHLMPLIAENEEFSDIFEELHEVGGTAMYVLIGLHTAAALFHHYIAKDNTLTRMLPLRR